LVIKDRDDTAFIKGSWRTTEEVNVGRLAKMMGGGGHEKAAGFAVQDYKI
jgi:phosphoesterase RecJ-like protein